MIRNQWAIKVANQLGKREKLEQVAEWLEELVELRKRLSNGGTD